MKYSPQQQFMAFDDKVGELVYKANMHCNAILFILPMVESSEYTATNVPLLTIIKKLIS